jgi:hypothetical protein
VRQVSLEEVKAAFGACGTLAEAILVGLRRSPAWSVVEVVVQDEYTHDVILLGAPDGPAIVLDCT